MSYWKLSAFILVIVLIGVAIFFFFFSEKAPTNPSPTTSTTGFGQPAQNISPLNQTKSPTEFTTNFYAWYVQNFTSDVKFGITKESKSAINEWLTSEFAKNWDTIIANTESDPVLLAQDYQSSWLGTVHATVVDQTATTSTILVSLGTAAELHQLTVHLIFSNNEWRIDSVTSAP